MMVPLQPVLSDSSVSQEQKRSPVVVSAGDALGRKELREKSKEDKGHMVGTRCAGGPRCGEVLVFAAPWAVTSLAELCEQCQTKVLAQPPRLQGEKSWLPSAAWDGSESF